MQGPNGKPIMPLLRNGNISGVFPCNGKQ